MTTVKDLLRDMLKDAEERMQTFADKGLYPVLTTDDKEDLLEEYTGLIKDRIVG